MHSFRAAVERAAAAAKIPTGWRIHDLRHRRVTTWLAGGHSPALVQEAMGHSSPTVTAIYTHLAREHLRALADEGDLEALRQLAAEA